MFGSETWVMNPRTGSNLSGFHHMVDCCKPGIQPKRDMEGRWDYPPMDEEMVALGIEEVDKYILI